HRCRTDGHRDERRCRSRQRSRAPARALRRRRRAHAPRERAARAHRPPGISLSRPPPGAALLAPPETPLRARLREMLATAWPELEIVAEAADGDEAVARARELAPDVAFLDIRMPGRTGLDAAIEISERSRVVFVTAYDEHALAAFDAGAVDYLL